VRQILIVSNNEVFQAERRRRHGDLPALAHDQLPATASILVGKRPLLLGGGPTRLGYVMRAGAAIGTIRVSADEARLGALTVK
jgi:hypothetical protein